jgi:hypothetical protein
MALGAAGGTTEIVVPGEMDVEGNAEFAYLVVDPMTAANSVDNQLIVPTFNADPISLAPDGSLMVQTTSGKLFYKGAGVWNEVGAGTGGSESWAQTLALGQTSGGLDPQISSGQQLKFLNSIRIGGLVDAGPNTSGSLVIGSAASAPDPFGQATAVGGAATVSGEAGTAVGTGAGAGATSTAVGTNAQAPGQSQQAFGAGATVQLAHTNSSALGYNAVTTAANQLRLTDASQTVSIPGALDVEGNVNVDGSITMDVANEIIQFVGGVQVHGNNQNSGGFPLPPSTSISIGGFGYARGTNAVAIGQGAGALNDDSVALGPGAICSFDNSVHISNGTPSLGPSAANQILLGGAFTRTVADTFEAQDMFLTVSGTCADYANAADTQTFFKIPTVAGPVANINGSTGYILVDTNDDSFRWHSGGAWHVADTGSVTSVDLAAPAEFTVSGNPVTSSGTLTLTKASQAANLVWASPDGAPGAPTFRALVANDLPGGGGSGDWNSVLLAGASTGAVDPIISSGRFISFASNVSMAPGTAPSFFAGSTNSIAVGTSITMGTGALVSDSVAIGDQVEIGDNSTRCTAVGPLAVVDAGCTQSSAFGFGATVNPGHNNSIAIGGSTGASNQIALGGGADTVKVDGGLQVTAMGAAGDATSFLAAPTFTADPTSAAPDGSLMVQTTSNELFYRSSSVWRPLPAAHEWLNYSDNTEPNQLFINVTEDIVTYLPLRNTITVGGNLTGLNLGGTVGQPTAFFTPAQTGSYNIRIAGQFVGGTANNQISLQMRNNASLLAYTRCTQDSGGQPNPMMSLDWSGAVADTDVIEWSILFTNAVVGVQVHTWASATLTITRLA